jgi:hypothetical protein
MNNEPVAWTDGKGNYFDKNSFFPLDDLIPLYTHTAKTLTDEEMLEYVVAFSQQEGSVYVFQEENILEMIRSILESK